MPNAKTNLVIVESPSKAKTIGKYLGPEYQVKASMGHLRDLRKSTMSVDIENDFEPEYYPIKGKEDIIKDLQSAAAKSANVFLATDPDREGEAISWHLAVCCWIPDDKTRTASTFNEITKDGRRETPSQHPRAIDHGSGRRAAGAARARPHRGLSASARFCGKRSGAGLSRRARAVRRPSRLVVDRENEIRAFQAAGILDHRGASLTDVQGKHGALRPRFLRQAARRRSSASSEAEDAGVLSADPRAGTFTVSRRQEVDSGSARRAPPFITSSTLQQDASRKLGFDARSAR